MSIRTERVAQLIRDEISRLLQKEISDPLIGFVTITDVEVSPDLRHARVYYSVLGDEETVRDATRGLIRARKYITGRIAENIDLRYVPELRFLFDDTAARADRIERILREEKAAREAAGETEAPDGDDGDDT